MSKWIKVGDHLPAIAKPYVEHGHWVLGWDKRYGVVVCCRSEIDYELWEWVTECGDKPTITHWMELPSRPDHEQEQ